MFRNYGYCHCCTSKVEFTATTDWWRDSYLCSNCGSLPRERALMFCIETFFPQWRELVIHESSPIPRGASERLRLQASSYMPTQFFPNVTAGDSFKGYRCENLEELTIGNDSVDLHVTQDVFEHLFAPAAAFREIARTLRPGGAHVFTTPLVQKNNPSQFCAQIAPEGTITHNVPAEYHSNAISDEGSLVTVKWGYDIANYIFEACGLFTQIVFIDNLELGIRADYIEVLITYKPPALCSQQ
jgi:SAM-dependent methyltransferase